MKRGKEKSKKQSVRTTVSLPEDVWRELRIESIKEKISMGELIARKLKELKELKKRKSIASPED